MKKFKVVLIEPSLIIQHGIKSVLNNYPEFELVKCYADFDPIHSDIKQGSPDIILINPSTISLHKHFSIRNIFPEHSSITIISLIYNYFDVQTVNSFDGNIGIYDNEVQIINELKNAVKSGKNHQVTDNVDLSDREKEILISVAQGFANKEIANKHNISIHTVISHRKNITRKTGIKTVAGLTVYAIFNNLLVE